jgi:DNA modification methylase
MNDLPHRIRRRQRPAARVPAGQDEPPLPLSQSRFLAQCIEIVPLASIVPYAGNPRAHADAQVDRIARSMDELGVINPIIVDKNNEIVAGHGRYAAAKKLGLAAVPIIRVSHLTPAHVKAFRIADNRLAELSLWDDKALAVELRELTAIELSGVEVLDLTGFEIGEIDARLEIVDKEKEPDEADLVGEPDDGPAVSQIGDVGLLGKHRLICGSALEEPTYVALLDGHKVKAVWSDPPYNVKVNGHISGLGNTKHREFVQASGEMSEAEFIAFLTKYLILTKLHSVLGSLHYSCMDAAHNFELLNAARQAKLSFKTTCTWAKTSAGMGSLYRSQTEFVHVFKNGGDEVRHTNNVQLGKYGRSRSTLWTYAGVNTFGRHRMEELKSHPTVKPWAMVADAIRDCTAHGETVLDAFCGSGTTIIAAEKVGRVGFGIELDPKYVDVAVLRWERVTGQQATNAVSGLTFAEVAKTRADGEWS